MNELDGVRERFPALRREVDGRIVAYLDGPGGTQVPRSVIDAMSDFLGAGASNLHGDFAASRASDTATAGARSAIADLFNASNPSEIAFGQNMTSITLAVSRAIGATLRPGDNVVVTRLDHDANVWPWVLAARDAGCEVRRVEFDPDAGCALDLDSMAAAVDDRTRVVAVTHASNAVGSIVDVAEVTRIAHRVGALVYVDAVAYTPHGSLDVQEIGCDFLVASAYKFFGPHTGCLYGRSDVLETLPVYKVRPAPDEAPDRWETGTQSFESLAGVTAAVDYLASLGTGEGRRARLTDAMARIGEYEAMLAQCFLDGIAEMPGIRLFGTNDVKRRAPIFAIEIDGRTPDEVAAKLGAEGVFVWSGDYYAVEVMERLGRAETGLIRVGFVHYNKGDEVDRVLGALERSMIG
jgi:cysteine desulfurase family protein (TIGR01976 family)